MDGNFVINNFKAAGYEFLSNFYETPVEMDGIVYRNSEAAFQAHKVLSREERLAFENLTGVQAKRFGKKVAIRDDWEDVKVGIMLECVRAKFFGNKELAERLLATGDAELVEGNTWNDTFWGVSLRSGKGRNELGKILMQVREELRKGENPEK